MYQLPMLQLSRRDFLRAATTIGAVGCFGAHHAVAAAEPPPETTTIRLVHAPSICTAPQYIAEELLRLDGFTDVQYLPLGTRNGPYALADGRGDIAMWDTPGLIPHLDAGKPIVLLSGVHAGCYELFGQEEVRAIRDLKGKTVAIQYVGGGDQVLISSMLRIHLPMRSHKRKCSVARAENSIRTSSTRRSSPSFTSSISKMAVLAVRRNSRMLQRST